MQGLRRKFGVEIVVVCVLTVIVGGFMGGLALTGRLNVDSDEAELASRPDGTHHYYRLVVYEQASCGWCVRFREDLGPWYERTKYQLKAPLTYTQIRNQGDGRYELKGRVTGTPTLVVVNPHGQEIGRLSGYPRSRDRFMDFLDRYL